MNKHKFGQAIIEFELALDYDKKSGQLAKDLAECKKVIKKKPVLNRKNFLGFKLFFYFYEFFYILVKK